MHLDAHRFPSPIGDLIAVASHSGSGALGWLRFADEADVAAHLGRPGITLEWGGAWAAPVEREIGEYFAGRRTTFELALDPAGTPFQRSVWRAVSGIPFGATATYGGLAAALGRPGASRAVGRANATNPLPLIVPCHRVIGAGRALTGYGGGLERKRWLLELEARAAAE